MIIDGDAHLDEFDEMWSSYSPEQDRELALRVVYDERGFAWLTFQGRQLLIMDHLVPGDFSRAGTGRALWRAGADNAPELRRETSPPDYSDMSARVARMDEWGIDSTILYPNFGFLWEGMLVDDLDAVRVNCAAWNRWAADLTREHGGRIRPVGHLVVQGNPDWVEQQLRVLSDGGVRQAMFSPGLVNGLRMSHPDNDRLWGLFVEYGVTPSWHVDSRMTTVFQDSRAWYDNDRDSQVQLMPFLFNTVVAQMGIADLAANGVFERFPELRIVVAEVGAMWYPGLLTKLDMLWEVMDLNHGRPLGPLSRPPGDYIRERVVVTCSFPRDAPVGMVTEFPDTFAFGTDYPHPEGIAGGVKEYAAAMGPLPEEHRARFFGGNLEKILVA